MKRACIRTAALAALVAAAAALPVLAETMYARFSTPVRADRALGAATFGTLQQGDAVQVTGREGSYYSVAYRGRTGWVYYNRLAGEEPEDVTALIGGLGGEGIQLTELEAGGALRGLSPMAENYARAADIPRWAVDAVEAMQARSITAYEMEAFQKEGGLGEYGGGVAP
jgi:hypothetical protein